MADFASDILNSIKNDREFKFNPVIMAVVETLENKRQNFQVEDDYLSAIKESLSSVNAYVKNQKIEGLIVKIDEKLATDVNASMHTKVNRMYYEIDMPGALNAIRESSVYSEPVVKKYVDAAVMEMQSNKMPYFKYLPGFMGTLSTYRTDAIINEWCSKFEKYVEDNRKKLMLLETIHYLDGIGNGFYRGVTEKLKPFALSNDVTADKIMFEMKDFTVVPIVKEMIMAMQAQEASDGKQFNLGPGDGNTKVFNYVGPVLKENNNMILLVDGKFLNITNIAIDEKNIERVFGTTGDITIQEVKPEYVYEAAGEYYQIAKSFEYLNFKANTNGVNTKLRNINVDFKVNEAGDLNLYLNDQHIEDPKAINFHQMLVLENNYVKTCSTILFNNIDKVYNVEFVKLLVNESKNAASLIINVNEEYYVYDFIEDNKRNVFKTDGFNLQKFVLEKFGYDVRELFSIQINDVKDKVGLIEKRKTEIQDALSKLDESYAILDETINNPQTKPEDVEMLRNLVEKVEKERVALKNAYILLEDEKLTAMGQNQTDAPANFKLGDNVTYGDNKNGRIVASDPDGKNFSVFTSEGHVEKTTRDSMTKAQSTNEAKSQTAEEKAQEVEDKAKEDAQKEEKAQEKAQAQEEKAQSAQEKTQAQEEKTQDAQAQTQAQEDKSQQAQQGIVSQPQPTSAQPTKTDGSFKEISSQFGELRSALDTVRPEVKEKFEDLTDDLDVLIKQTGELESLRSEIDNIKTDKVDFSKVEKKFGKLVNDLKNIAGELTAEFGKGAQQVVLSESMITSAYDKYIGVVSSVADKLTTKVSNIVKKLSGDIIDLDADVKVLGARSYAAKAKEELAASAEKNTDIPVAGPDAGVQATLNMEHDTQAQAQEAQAQAQEAQAQAQETQAQAQETQAQAQDADKYKANLEGMTNENLAKEYADIFSMDEADVVKSIATEKANMINEMLEVFKTVTNKK